MKKVLFSLSAFIVLLSACNKYETTSGAAVNMSLTASIEEGNDIKTQLDASTLEVSWNIGDKIKLFDSNNNSAVWAVASIDAKGVATFTMVEGSVMADGTILAYYPAESAVEAPTMTNIKVNVPSTQRYSKGSFGLGTAPMVASTVKNGNDVTLNFKNLFGAFKYNLKTGTLKLRKMTLMSNEALCGEGTVDLSDPNNPTIMFTSGVKTVSIDDIEAKGTVTFYVPVPPASAHHLTTLADITDSNGDYAQKVKDSSVGHSVKRNYIREFNAISLSSFSDVQGAGNCYMVDCVNASETIIPVSQVMFGWNAIKSYGETEVRPEDVIIIINSGNWEIASVCNTSSAALVYEKIAANNGIYYAWKLKTPANVGGNNAIFAIKATADYNTVHSGDILWSWHIWYTDYKPAATQANTIGGQVIKLNTPVFTTGLYKGDHPMMDRNLGATITGVPAGASIEVPQTAAGYSATRGLTYQYGRKDPSIQNAEATSTMSYTESVLNPQMFLTTTGVWCSTDVDSPWGRFSDNSMIAVMSPCPAGWEVAACRYISSNNIFGSLGDGIPESVSSGEGASYFANVYDSGGTYRGRQYDSGGVKAYFPGSKGASTIYWGRESSAVGNGMSFTTSVSIIRPYVSYGRGRLSYIRCVKH